MSKKSIIFSTILIFGLGIISSVFLFSLINVFGDLFRDIGVEELPFVTGFVISTSPLVPVLVFLAYSVFAGIIFFIGQKISKKNMNMYRIIVFVGLTILTLLTLVLWLILNNSVYQITTVLN